MAQLLQAAILSAYALICSRLCPDPSLYEHHGIPSSWYTGGEETWDVRVLPGPNAEPDYFTPDDIKTFYSTTWKVHYNSNRLGIRLQGPRPQFARPDGGEGGSHPSNVHDHVYAIGTINFTGTVSCNVHDHVYAIGTINFTGTVPSSMPSLLILC